MADYPYAQWFDGIGACRGCRKPATGKLRSYFNNSNLGTFCQKCAEKEITAAHKLKKFEPDVCHNSLDKKAAE